MGHRGIALASLGLWVGCAPGTDGELVHRSVLEAATRGLALHADGTRGHAGMRGTNCPFETIGGRVTGDYDLPDEDEEVEDTEDTEDWGEETVLLLQPGVVHLLNKQKPRYHVGSRRVEGAFEARLARSDIAVRVERGEGCAVVWTESGADVDAPCSDGFDVDPETAVAWIGGEELTEVRPDGAHTLPDGPSGSLLAWDAATEALYVARQGDSVVTAVERGGAIRWRAEVGGPVTALTHGGRGEAAVVAWDDAPGGGALTWLDGWSGAPRRTAHTPGPAPALAMSANGRVLAVVLPDEAHFYTVR